jgi:integrase
LNLIDNLPHIELPPKPDSKVMPLSDAQIRALIDGCTSPHIRLAVILLLATGGRVGAILDLTWQRVDMERGIINLRLSDGIKRKGRAVIPMNAMARAALSVAYQARLSDHVIEYGGERVHSIRTGFNAACERAGLGNVHLHQLRHTAAVKLIEAGRPMEEVGQYLGHSNPAVTHSTYARFRPEALTEAADILNFDLTRKKM